MEGKVIHRILASHLFDLWPLHHFRRRGVGQFVKFGIIGVVNTTLDFSVYFILTRWVPFFHDHILTANAISFSLAVTNSYILNTRWTFRGTHSAHTVRFPKFLATNIFALGINELLLLFFVSSLNLHDLISKAMAVALTLFWNFFVNKYWVFRKYT